MNRAAIARGFERARRFMAECQRYYDAGLFPYQTHGSLDIATGKWRTWRVWLVKL